MKLIAKEDLEDYYDKFWSYCFLKNGMNFAFSCLSTVYLEGVDAVFVDEVGALELQSRGFSDHVSAILSSNIPNIFLVVREQFIEAVCIKFNIPKFTVIRVKDRDDSINMVLELSN